MCESGKTDINTKNESTNGKESILFTNEQLVLKFLKCQIDILPETCQRFIQNYLDPTCEILSSNGINRGILNFVTHSHMALKDVP